MTMRVAVLGAGLQGACIAMELASAGVQVDLYDQKDRCLTQASAKNEGKIHLGYVYANDPSRRTARTMIRGAVTFSSLLRRWIGDAIDAIPVSSLFYYIVHADSLLSVSDIERHFQATHGLLLEESQDVPLDYLGSDYRVPPSRMAEAEWTALFDRRKVLAAFRTPEIAIDAGALAVKIRARLSEDPRIQCRLQTIVHGADRGETAVTIEHETAGRRARERYDHVVNCLWDGRLAIDRTAGVEPHRPWIYRFKHYLRLRPAPGSVTMPSTTLVLGAFGDSVAYNDGSLYFSWYPACMRGTSTELVPPLWPRTLDPVATIEMRQAILNGLSPIIPAVAKLRPADLERFEVGGCIIIAWGQTDIDDRASGLHERYAIGPQSHDRYHTVDTGKLTTAPWFGKMVADRILQRG